MSVGWYSNPADKGPAKLDDGTAAVNLANRERRDLRLHNSMNELFSTFKTVSIITKYMKRRPCFSDFFLQAGGRTGGANR